MMNSQGKKNTSINLHVKREVVKHVYLCLVTVYGGNGKGARGWLGL
jgi:hypothetical protein